VHRFELVNFDDQVYVTNNPHVRAGLTWAGIVWAFSSTYAANWHPITWISHMTDVQLFGPAPGPPHVVNLVLHVINVLLVWFVLRRLTGSMSRSAIVAGLFAVHPLHVESVAWVAERKDLLSTLFALLTISAYADYVRRTGASRYVLALVWFALGLMSKPMLVTLPIVLVLLDAWPLRRPRALADKVPFALLAIASSVITLVAQQRGGAVATLEATPLALRVANALVAYTTYIQQTIWPVGLSAFYPLPASPPVADAIAALAVLAVITAAAVGLRRSRPYVLTGWLWFVVTLVPVIGVIQVGAQAHADRYTYLPLIGLFVVVVWGIADLGSRFALPQRALAAAAVAVIVACAVATRVQAGYWQDGISLWQHAVDVNPGNSRAHTNLGTSLAAAGRGTEAIAEYRKALDIEPTLPQAHNNLGLALMKQGHTDEAIVHLREAVRLKPAYGEARNSLGNALMDQHRVDEAIEQFEEAVRLRPGEPQIHNNLGAAYAERGRMVDATAQFLEAVRLEPNRAEWQYAAGMAYAVQGDTARAVQYLKEAIRLDPGHERARRALADIGR
jgi:Flp pilus assembly protein TadD